MDPVEMSSPATRSFPGLKGLLDGWFHQDFDLDGDGLEAILPKYARAVTEDRVRQTIAEIKAFLDSYGKDDATLREAVERVLAPEIEIEGWEGMTTREWLLKMLQLLGQAANAHRLRE